MLPPAHPPQILSTLTSDACSSAGVRIGYRWSWTRGDWRWRRHVVLTVGSWSPLPRSRPRAVGLPTRGHTQTACVAHHRW